MKTLLCAVVLCAAASAQELVPLWQGVPPGAPLMAEGREAIKDGHVSNVMVPDLTFYRAVGVTGAAPACIVLPGGGYTILAIDKEGHEVARWLAAHGVSAAVVKYRVSADDASGYFFPVPLLDARRAIRIVRSRAEGWGVDPDRIGVMGFSAGGHLASLCATTWDQTFKEEPSDRLGGVNPRPDFVALIYPVINDHGGSMRRLLGAQPDAQLQDRCATDRHVNPRTPPAFLVHAADDPVSCRNSMAFQAACLEQKVPVSFHLFAKGGHGYGLRSKAAVRVWPELMADWLEDIGMLPAR